MIQATSRTLVLRRAGPAPDALTLALFGLLPLAATVWLLAQVHAAGIGAVDFHNDFLPAAHRLLRGEDLYAWSPHQIADGFSFPYPAPAALLFAPFALLPAAAGGTLITALCLLAIPAALWSLSVRDWRIYGLVLVWLPVVVGWQTANLSLPLAFGIGLVWRWRERPLPAGVLVALLVCIKPIALPLVLWLLASRRYRASLYALAGALAANLLAWSIVGFGGVHRWLALLSLQGDLLYRKGYSLIALIADAGLGRGAGTLVEALAALVLAAICVLLGRRADDARCFVLAVALMVVASPQVDLHYFALAIVPLALLRPRFGPCWLAPLLLWACPTDAPAAWQVAFAWVLVAGIVVALLHTPREPVDAGPQAGVLRAA